MSKFCESETDDFATALEASFSAFTVIEVFLDDCNAATRVQQAKCVGMLVSTCCALVADRYGGMDAVKAMLSAVHDQIAEAVELRDQIHAANPGAGMMQ